MSWFNKDSLSGLSEDQLKEKIKRVKYNSLKD